MTISTRLLSGALVVTVAGATIGGVALVSSLNETRGDLAAAEDTIDTQAERIDACVVAADAGFLMAEAASSAQGQANTLTEALLSASQGDMLTVESLVDDALVSQQTTDLLVDEAQEWLNDAGFATLTDAVAVCDGEE